MSSKQTVINLKSKVSSNLNTIKSKNNAFIRSVNATGEWWQGDIQKAYKNNAVKNDNLLKNLVSKTSGLDNKLNALINDIDRAEAERARIAAERARAEAEKAKANSRRR